MPKFFCMPFFACNRQVDSLDKRQCNLQVIPTEIERYSRSLEELLLDMNHIKELPKSLFRLHRLQRLGISDNDVYKIPSEISHLQNLIELNVSRNDISDIPDELKNCKNLRIFDISSNPIARLPESISQVTSLTHLNLNDTSLTKLPQDFGNLQNLKSLEIRENHLHTLPSSFGQLINLHRLDIGQNELDNFPSEIFLLRNLQELYFDENHVEELSDGILNCRYLEQLDISSNKLMKLPENFGDLERLTDVILSQNCLQSLPNSIRLLKRLQILKVDNNNIQQLTPAIGSCSNLQELYLMHNLLTELPSTIANLRKLQVLNVDKNQLLTIPSLIGNCENLTVLSIRDNQIKELPLEIGKLVKLRVLDVSGNNLRYLPFTINVLFNLQALWLSENQSQALLKFQQVQDPISNMRVLTCYLLPQQSGTHESTMNKNAKAFIGGPKVHFGGMENESTIDEEGGSHLSTQNFERHDTPHPKPHQNQKVKKSTIDGHVIHHAENKQPTALALTRKYSEDKQNDFGTINGPRSALKHPNPHQPFAESASSDNLISQDIKNSDSPTSSQFIQLEQPPVSSSLRRNVAFQMPNGASPMDDENGECRLKRINTPHYKNIRSGVGINNSDSGTLNPLELHLGMPQVDSLNNTSTTISTPIQRQSPTIIQQIVQQQPLGSIEREIKRIIIRRNANSTGLGLSIAGGVESTPYIDNDTGLFVSKLTPGGAAEQCGLRIGDKLLEVNGTNMVNQRHDIAVQCMQKPVENVIMMIQRETIPTTTQVPIKTLTHEMRSGSSPNTSLLTENSTPNKDMISTTVSKDIHGSPGFSLTQLKDEIVISALKPGGPAEKENKIKIGDILISVNGNSVIGLTLEQISNLITVNPGEVYLVVQRKPTSPTPKINGNSGLSYGDTAIDNTTETVELIRDENNSLGLSIVGGIDHCSHPFGVNNPGVFISKIAPNSPASNCGKLRIGDRILSVNKEIVDKAKHNDAVTIIKNAGKKLVITVKHDPQPTGLREVVIRRRKHEPIGLSICGGINSPKANPNDPLDEGIFVETIEKESAADECGQLKPGIRILEINEDSLLGYTQVEAANLFRKSDSIIRLLVCDGFNPDSNKIQSSTTKLTEKIIPPQTQSFPARKMPEYQNQVAINQSYVNLNHNGNNITNGTTTSTSASKLSQIFKSQQNSPGLPLNFSEPPLAASSPIPAVPGHSLPLKTNGNGLNGYQSPNTSTTNASTSFSTGTNQNTSTNSNVTLNASSLSNQTSTTTFTTNKPNPPPVAPKPKPKVIPVTIDKSPTSPQNPPETLNFTSKLKKFESEINVQTNGANNNVKIHSISASSLPSKKPLFTENDLEKIQEDASKRQPSPSPLSPEISMESVLNTSLTGTGLQIIRTKKAENRLAVMKDEPLNSVEQHELDIRKRHEWRQARLASLDAETKRADQIMKQLSAKRLNQISEERSLSTSPSRVLHNESSVENITKTENGTKTVSIVEMSVTQREV